MSMNLIQTVTLSSATAAIDFTGIPQTASDLLILVSSRAENFNGKVTFNNSSALQYSYRNLVGDSGGRVASTGTDESFLIVTSLHEPRDFNGTNNTVGIVSSGSIYISNYTGSQNKSIGIDTVMEHNSNSSYQTILAGRWSNSSAITSVKIETTSGNLLPLTSISLYTITRAQEKNDRHPSKSNH